MVSGEKLMYVLVCRCSDEPLYVAGEKEAAETFKASDFLDSKLSF